ncbi:hypothetical protein, partial [Elizabethkingia meningoseptica]|uniref:hypothetical protein n=1 Tax=Elizabethkingia meningoseptica TaxID=238 RepID=UPI003198B465
EDWLEAEGGKVADLGRNGLSRGLRRVVDRCLDGVEGLLVEARRLPAGLASRRLAMESAVIVDIAVTLSGKLRREDPLAARVALGKPAFVWCGVRGIASVLASRG